MKLLVKGKVQGVGYRFSVFNQIQTQNLDVVGYIYNQPDASVEIIVETEDIENLKKIRHLAWQGSSNCQVREIIEEIKPINKYSFNAFFIKEDT